MRFKIRSILQIKTLYSSSIRSVWTHLRQLKTQNPVCKQIKATLIRIKFSSSSSNTGNLTNVAPHLVFYPYEFEYNKPDQITNPAVIDQQKDHQFEKPKPLIGSHDTPEDYYSDRIIQKYFVHLLFFLISLSRNRNVLVQAFVCGKYVSSKLEIRCLSRQHTTISSCSWFIRFSWFRLVPREIGAEKAVRGLPFYFSGNFWKFEYDAPGPMVLPGLKSVPIIEGDDVHSFGHHPQLYCFEINRQQHKQINVRSQKISSYLNSKRRIQQVKGTS